MSDAPKRRPRLPTVVLVMNLVMCGAFAAIAVVFAITQQLPFFFIIAVVAAGMEIRFAQMLRTNRRAFDKKSSTKDSDS